MYKKVLLAAAAAALTLGSVSAANAADGCGRGFHRGPYGHCHADRGPGPVIGIGPLAIGVFYPGHGYWDGHRYWGHRDAWHGGWRYR
jgi:hypothetical protein